MVIVIEQLQCSLSILNSQYEWSYSRLTSVAIFSNSGSAMEGPMGPRTTGLSGVVIPVRIPVMEKALGETPGFSMELSSMCRIIEDSFASCLGR